MSKTGEQDIWARALADGATAVALFNRAAAPAKVKTNWSASGISGPKKLRDLWSLQNVASTGADYEATVPGHGVVMLRVK